MLEQLSELCASGAYLEVSNFLFEKSAELPKDGKQYGNAVLAAVQHNKDTRVLRCLCNFLGRIDDAAARLHVVTIEAEIKKRDQSSNDQFKWDATSYAQNSTPQATRNTAALKIFGVHKGEQGLDIGCGNAKTTRQMALDVGPDGKMLGIDSSDAMVKKAVEDNSDMPNLTIMHGDALQFRFYKPFDFITSFFCLQWIPVDLLPMALTNILDNLKSDGRLCVLVPCYDFPHKIIKGVAASDKWKSHFAEFKDKQTFLPAEYYNDQLAKIGFKQIEIVIVESEHVLSDQEFIDYTQQWCGCYSSLKDKKLLDDFVQDVLARLAIEKHQHGKITMVQESMRMFARKPAAQAVDVSLLIEISRVGLG